MLISLCTPVMNRVRDLKYSMPYRIEAALKSPPVEFCVLDYNSNDGLAEYIQGLELPREISLHYRRYEGREHYHQAHAYNLSITMSSGKWFCLMGADTYPIGRYFEAVRDLIAQGYLWIEDKRYKGAIVCNREEFIDAGGYDERFEFYGPEDRELAARLTRRRGKKGILPPGLIVNTYTPDDVKVENYRVKESKQELSRMMRPIYEENERMKVLSVNPNGWAQWN